MKLSRPMITAVMIVVIVVLSYVWVVPKYNQFRQLQTSIAQKEAEYQAKYDYYSEVARAYDEIQQKKDVMDMIDNALPSTSQLGRLIYYLQKTCNESGLVAKDISLAQAPSGTSDGKIKEIIFSLSLMGKYSSLKNFMATLEKTSRLFEIPSISFSSSAKQAQQTSSVKKVSQLQSDDIYSFNVQVKTYTY